jgi:hypothetical protein
MVKVLQTITREGDNLILSIIEHPSGRVVALRVWEGAGKYVRPKATKGYLTLMVPERCGLDIKPS